MSRNSPIEIGGSVLPLEHDTELGYRAIRNLGTELASASLPTVPEVARAVVDAAPAMVVATAVYGLLRLLDS